jgi:hypothetical protein
MPWQMYVPAAIGTTLLIATLVTGWTLNPMSGMRPMIVRRKLSPGLYWWSVALLVFFTAVALFIALSGYLVKS